MWAIARAQEVLAEEEEDEEGEEEEGEVSEGVGMVLMARMGARNSVV